MSEEWRPVVGFEGLYEVSDQGRVRSLDRLVRSECALRGYPRRVRGRLLAPQKHSAGYLQVALCGELRLVHAVVLGAFVGPRPAGKECAHCDGDKHNNRLGNLAYKTHVENVADRTAHGTEVRGERNGFAKLTEAQVLAIRARQRLSRAEDLATAYDVHEHHIRRLWRGERWRHV